MKRYTVDAIPRKSITYVKAACQTKLTKRTMLFTKYARKDFLTQVQKDDFCISIGGDNYCYAGIEILGDLKKDALITVRETLIQAVLAAVGVIENVRAFLLFVFNIVRK